MHITASGYINDAEKGAPDREPYAKGLEIVEKLSSRILRERGSANQRRVKPPVRCYLSIWILSYATEGRQLRETAIGCQAIKNFCRIYRPSRSVQTHSRHD